MTFEPATLEGRHVRLEPLAERHLEGLAAAVRDGELWTLFVTRVPHPDQLGAWFAEARAQAAAGEGLSFATVDVATGAVAGSTRFFRASPVHRRVEIGHTFLARSFQRGPTNTEAKLLMLAHAFDTLGMNRVELLTDWLNTRSRAAIERLGAKQEGILRSHMVMPDGRVRDSVLFSIVRGEWPGVHANLRHRLATAR